MRAKCLIGGFMLVLAALVCGCDKDRDRSGDRSEPSTRPDDRRAADTRPPADIPLISPLLHAREKGRIAAAKAMLMNVRVAVDTFEVDIGRYPTEQEGLKILVQAPESRDGERADYWRGPYLAGGLPKDPWGNPLVYKVAKPAPGAAQGRPYRLFSLGPDGQEGTPDDILADDK